MFGVIDALMEVYLSESVRITEIRVVTSWAKVEGFNRGR